MVMNKTSFVWLFHAGLMLLLLAHFPFSPTEASQATFSQLSLILGRIGVVLLALRVLTLLLYYPRYILASICMLVVFRFSYILGGTRNMFYLTLVVAASCGTDMKVALKIYLAYLVFFLIACPLSWIAGWTDNIVTHMGQLQGSSLGSLNPNHLALFLTMAIFLGLYLSKERRTVVIWVICWSAAALNFALTLCLTQTLLLLALPVVYLLFHRTRPTPVFLAILPIAFLAISILLACYYGPSYGSNTFVSRFSIPALVYQKYGLSMFGQDCSLAGWFNGVFPFNLPLDNGYLDLFLRDGLVTGLAGMAFLIHFGYLLGRKGDGLLSAITCCILASGMMEHVPFDIHFSFLPLFYFPFVEELSSASKRKTATTVPFAFALGAIIYAFMPWQAHRVMPHSNGTVGEITCPAGFVKTEYGPHNFSGFLENLPLARPDSSLTGYDGVPCDSLERFCYRVVDFPLLNENEQCADVCMHLRAEYLYRENRFRKINFADTRGKMLRYRFGACRPLFNRYLKKVFLWSNTKSMRQSMPLRPIKGLTPGDVLIYDEHARPDQKYGHAVIVAAVAVDTLSARKAVLLIQGSTPACDIHVVANPDAPDLSPWFPFDESGDTTPLLTLGKAVFYADDLRYFNAP